MRFKVAHRISDVKEYYFSKKLREVKQLDTEDFPVINLGIGSPDLAPDPLVIQQLKETSTKSSNHGYQAYKGLQGLREGFANWYKSQYEVLLDADKEILPLIGSKEGIFHISMAYLNEGDEVLVPNPGYPAYSSAAKLAGAKVVHFDLDGKHNWAPKIGDIESKITSRTKICWINYPNMPTGGKPMKGVLSKLIALCDAHDIILCHDNPYSLILTDEKFSIFQIANARKNCIELNSLSKAYNMAGWRVGVVSGNESFLDAIIKVKSNIDSGMFKGIQEAAITALNLEEKWQEDLNRIYKQRRSLVFELMDLLECTYEKDTSGLFVWGKIPNELESLEAFIDKILYDCHVFITPGMIFGTNGNRHVRISLCAPENKIREAINRIKAYKHA